MWAAPGRVNIIGEHTDYNNGYVLPIALPFTVRCAASARADGRVGVRSRQRAGEVAVAVDDLDGARAPGWARYPLGVVREYVKRGYPIPGVDLSLDGDVPVGAGLSSSAAVECSVAVALRDLFDYAVADEELIDIARAAENDYVGAPTGILDQSASVLCTAGHALFLDVATGDRAQIPFDLAAVGLALLVVDTNTPHALVDGEYAARRAQCEAAAAALGAASLREITDAAEVEKLHTATVDGQEGTAPWDDELLRRRARHVVTENARVLAVVDALRTGADPRAIGPVLSASHTSLRDDFAVSCPQLDAAADAATAAGAYGARMVGGGFGGSVIALVEADRAEVVSAAVADRFAAAGFAAPRTFAAVPAAGARRLE
ncbi:MAG: galactokinase [Mycobacteriaceae bacterium]|nr:galactokinase [Mycobacteriaceae bacterium]